MKNLQTFIDKGGILARGLKQDMEFKTEILKIMMLKLTTSLQEKSMALSQCSISKGIGTDIKSLKKAARQTIGPELEKSTKYN